MDYFLIALEFFMYAFAVIIGIRKKELAILYLPVLFFINTIIGEHYVSAFVYYSIVSLLLIYVILENSTFLKSNVFATALIVYFILLMGKVSDLSEIRQDLFNVMWLFFAVPLIPQVYKKHNREIVMEELGRSSFIILFIFILNVGLSSIFKFNVHSMYGITSGIIYGNLFATDFNIISIAIFIVLFRALDKRNFVYLITCVIALAFVGLSLRRSVIGLGLLGVSITILLYFIQNIKSAIVFTVIIGIACTIFFVKSRFITSFNERYEMRRLDDRALDEEKRVFEYEMLYRDMFVYHRYSAWFGFGLFDSLGNYGDGKLYDRTLHSDITSIAHSSGLLGLALYLLMNVTAFFRAVRDSSSMADNMLIIFCAIAFITYTLTGRFTQVGCMFLIMLALNIPSTSPVYDVEIQKQLDDKTEDGMLSVL